MGNSKAKPKPKQDEDPVLVNPFQTSNEKLIFSRSDLNVEIETQLTKTLIKIGAWVVASVLTIALGSIGTVLWNLNGDVKELSGKFSSPESVIHQIGNRADSLEKENKILNENIHKQEIDDLNKQIELLKNTKK